MAEVLKLGMCLSTKRTKGHKEKDFASFYVLRGYREYEKSSNRDTDIFGYHSK